MVPRSGKMASMDRQAAQDDGALRSGLAGVRGLLLDLDGVLVLKGHAIEGAAAAIDRLDLLGLPYRVVTNTSLVSRATLAGMGAAMGVPLPKERIMSALSATAAFTRRRFAGQPLYVLCAPDARSEFEGQHLMSHEQAAMPDATAAAVVVGDAAEEFTPRNILSAFRLVRSGARLVAMHRNRWWLTPDGPTLDAGAYVVGLEFATERRAIVLGKPSRAFFAEALRELALPSDTVAMVGDDLWNDVLAAQRAGLRGAFVLTGKHGPAELRRAAASAPPRGGAPDVVAASLAAIARALD